MANDYLVSKWRRWFGIIDINHRGEISKQDVKDEEERFAELSHLTPEQKKEMQVKVDSIWNAIVFRGRTGAIKEDEFVEMIKQHYTADKTKFKEELTANYTTLLTDVIDLKHEGVITEQEYCKIMTALGHGGGRLKEFFSLFNPVDGKVPIKAFVDAIIQFITSDDSSKKDIVLEGHKAKLLE